MSVQVTIPDGPAGSEYFSPNILAGTLTGSTTFTPVGNLLTTGTMLDWLRRTVRVAVAVRLGRSSTSRRWLREQPSIEELQVVGVVVRIDPLVPVGGTLQHRLPSMRRPVRVGATRDASDRRSSRAAPHLGLP